MGHRNKPDQARILAWPDLLRKGLLVMSLSILFLTIPFLALASPLQSIGDSFEGFAEVVLVGDATFGPEGSLWLTEEFKGQVGAVYHNSKHTLADGFETRFTFQIEDTNNKHADGFSFIIHNDPAGTGAIGDYDTYSGGGMGYAGISEGLVVAFDTWDWDGSAGFNPNEIKVMSKGADQLLPYATILSEGTPTFTFADGRIYTTTITYNTSSTPTLYIAVTDPQTPSNTFVLTTTVDLTDIAGDNILDGNGQAYIGFTAATGSWYDRHTILSWRFDNSGSGSIYHQWWTDITGSQVTKLTDHPDYAHIPTDSDYPTSFLGPINWADSYGTRWRGYLLPSSTGTYTFNIASDNASELWLSTDDTPANASIIATVSSYAWGWNENAEQQSAPVTLQANTSYYIEVRHKAGGGGDLIKVGWLTPGTSGTPVVIPGSNLQPYINPSTNLDAILRLNATTGILTDTNGAVITWTDQSGYDHVVNQTSSSQRPTWLANGINGQPALAFDGDDYLQVANSIYLNTGTYYSAKTLLLAFETGADVTTRQMLWEQGGDIKGLNIYLEQGLLYVNAWSTVDEDTTTPWGSSYLTATVSPSRTYYIDFSLNQPQGQLTASLNSSTMGVLTNTGHLFAHSGVSALGAVKDASRSHAGPITSTGSYFTGKIGHFEVYNYALTEYERQSRHKYLQDTYFNHSLGIAGNGLLIANNDTTPSTADGTDFGEVDADEGSTEVVTHTFILSNTGEADLILSGYEHLKITGNHASDFQVVNEPWGQARLKPESILTAQIVFSPSGSGVREAQVEVAYNSSVNSNSAYYRFDIQGVGTIDGVVPPVLKPTPADTTVAYNMATATEFLYTGPDKVQFDVVTGTIEATRTAVVRGKVLDVTGGPLAGVTVTVKSHPEYGYTYSREDGWFDLAINGGGLHIINYEKAGYLPLQRQTQVNWRQFDTIDEVVMTQLDTTVSVITLTNGGFHQSNVVSDTDGTRQGGIYFPAGVAAELVLTNGVTQTITQPVHVRVTEYTVGDYGPDAMPGDLPPLSGYTYAAELSLDEALAADATNVSFSQPVAFYVDNFLGFPVGEVVPVGTYDRQTGAWEAEENGRVIKIITITNGLAELDVTGSGTATPTILAELGITDTERAQLALTYNAGDELQRSTLDHFTPIDHNWGYVCAGFPEEGIAACPKPTETVKAKPPTPTECDIKGDISSRYSCENQTFEDVYILPGSSHSLHYNSGLTKQPVKLHLPLPPHFPARAVKGLVWVQIKSLGWETLVEFERDPNDATKPESEEVVVTFDPQSAYGQAVTMGSYQVEVAIGYSYQAIYIGSGAFGYAFGQPGVGGGGTAVSIQGRQGMARWTRYTFDLVLTNAADLGLGGWTLSNHHTLLGQTLLLGTGETQSTFGYEKTIDRVAGNTSSWTWIHPFAAVHVRQPELSGDGGPADEARLGYPNDIAFAPDGTIYIADGWRVRQIDPTTKVITTVAGKIKDEYGNDVWCHLGSDDITTRTNACGDGGPAIEATFSDSRKGNPQTGFGDLYIALGPDGDLYISDTFNYRIRKVDMQTGIITAFAGTGENCWYGTKTEDMATNCGDWGPATQAKLTGPKGLAFSPDGELCFAEGQGGRIRCIDTNGIIYTKVSKGFNGYPNANDAPALEIGLQHLFDVAFDPTGNLYLSEAEYNISGNIRMLRPDGIVTVVAGGGPFPWYGNEDFLPGDPATPISIKPRRLDIDENGIIYFYNAYQKKIFKVENDLVQLVAGTGGGGYYDDAGDGGSPQQAFLGDTTGLGVAPDGSLYILDRYHHVVRAIKPTFPGFSTGDIVLPAKNGQEIYVFDFQGRHKQTLDSFTKAVLYEFSYTTYGDNQYLTKISDVDGLETTIQRDSNGTPQSICSPYNQCVTLGLDANGYLNTLTNPASETYTYTYTTDGLVTQKQFPNGSQSTLTYDATGKLISGENPIGKQVGLARIDDEQAYTVTVTLSRHSTISDTALHLVEQTPSEGQRRQIIQPNGSIATQIIEVDGTVVLTNVNGTVLHTQYTPDPRWDMQAPLANISLETADGTPFFTADINQTVTLTNPNDPLSLKTFEEDITVNGRVTQREYITATRTWLITDPAGRVVTTTLDAKGRVVSSDASDLALVAYAYDSDGRLSTVTEGNGNQARTITMTYYSSGPANGALQRITDPLGNITSYGYDAALRVLTQTLPTGHHLTFAYDANGNLTDSTDARGVVTSYEYDAYNRLTAIVVDSAPGGKQVRAEYTYDLADNLIKVVADAGTGRLNATSLYTYTPFSASGGYLLAAATDPEGHTTQYGYTPYGATAIITDTGPNGTRTTVYSYTEETWLAGITSPTGQIVNYNYDDEGRLTTVTDPRGVTTRYVYDSDANGGRLKQVIAGDVAVEGQPALDLTTTYTYKPQSHLLAKITNPGGFDTTFTYDQFGRQITIADHLGDQNSVSYDALDRPITVVEGSNIATQAITTTYTYDTLSRLTHLTTDPTGLALTTIYTYSHPANSDTWSLGQAQDPNGNVTQYQYNSFGLLDTLTDADGQAWTYLYNNLGWLTNLRDPLYSLSPNRETTYTYDTLGQPLNLSRNSQTEQVSYHPDGSVYTSTDFAGYVMTYTYNNDGWLTTVDYDDSHPVPVDDTTLTYDAVGNVITMSDGLGNTTYTYDAANRLTSRSRGGKTITYTYNANSQITDIAYWGTGSVSYAYDNANRLTSLTPWGENSLDYTWQANGRLDSVTRGTSDNLTSAYTYDTAGRLTGILHDYTTTPLAHLTYAQRDNNGNLLTFSEDNGSQIFTTTYTYDALNRLDTVTYPSLTAISGPGADTDDFMYDAVGNLTGIDAPVRPAETPLLEDRLIYLPLIIRQTE